MKNNSDRSTSSRRAIPNEVPMISQFYSRLMQGYAVDILSRQSKRRLNTLIRNQNSILKGISESLVVEAIFTEGIIYETTNKEHIVTIHGKTKHVYKTSSLK